MLEHSRTREGKALREALTRKGAPGPGVIAEPVDSTEADWSSGVRSTVRLPPGERQGPGETDEFSYFTQFPKGSVERRLDKYEREFWEDEKVEIERMGRRMDALLPPAIP